MGEAKRNAEMAIQQTARAIGVETFVNGAVDA